MPAIGTAQILRLSPADSTAIRAHRAPPRRTGAGALVCRAGHPSQGAPQFAEWSQAVPTPTPWAAHPLSLTMAAVTLLEAAALVGAVVTGILARKRRQQLEETNGKLRRINAELRRQKEAAAPPEEAQLAAHRTVLERSLGAPSAAHPVETYGSLKTSLARARRAVEEGLRDARAALAAGGPAQALALLEEALQTSRDIKDSRAERAVVRLRARALRAGGDLPASLNALQRVLELNATVGEAGEGDADTLGEMGDILAEMGEYEAAGKYYDLTISAIQRDDGAAGGVGTWDAA